HGTALQLAAAGKCDRELRQDRPENSGEDHPGFGAERRSPAPAGHERRTESASAGTDPNENFKATEPPCQPQYNPWLIAVVVAVAAFMEVLDTSIANVALPYMAGNLGASNDESTWVLTSYLVSNAIVLPISGWFAVAFGRKRFFMVCLAIFT